MTLRHQRTSKFIPWVADKNLKERSHGIKDEVTSDDKMTSQKH
jgi:hypothetical protein